MRFIKEVLLENWGLKLTALFLACVLWTVVRGDPSAERIISVPLEVRVPRNMEITNERPYSVDVTVRGAFSNIWVGPTVPTYIIDLQTYGEGKHDIQLSPGNVRFSRASGLEAIAVRPARLKFTLERTVANEVPIRVKTAGEPDRGIDLYDIYSTPRTALLSGPRSSIERIPEVDTEAISLTGLRQSFRTFVNLVIKDDAVRSSPAGPVEINIRLGAHRRLQSIARVPVVPDDGSVTVSPRGLTIQALVPITYDKGLTAADFSVTVALANLDPSQPAAKVKPEVKLKSIIDPAIVIKDIQPAEVTVRRNRKS